MSKFDDKYMQMAAIWATNSYCKRRQVGALLVRVILKQQHEAQYHIYCENEPRTVFDEKVEQIIHRARSGCHALSA